MYIDQNIVDNSYIIKLINIHMNINQNYSNLFLLNCYKLKITNVPEKNICNFFRISQVDSTLGHIDKYNI